MKLFLIWADRSLEMKSLVSKLEKDGHEIVYWVGLGDENENFIKGAIFHDHYQAWAGLPADGVDKSQFVPPSKDLIEKMYRTESLVLTMMNKRFDTDCVDKRKHLYYNMLQYWHGVIKKYKPDVILFPTVPHTVYNYIIYSLAKQMGIKTLMFEDSWVSDRLLTYEDWEEGSPLLHEVMKKNEDKHFHIDDLSEDLQKYYRLQTDDKKDATPVYMQHWKKKFSKFNLLLGKFKILAKSIKDRTVLNKILNYFKKLKNNLKKEYTTLEIKADLNKKFIYVPLNFQPERTTSPQGDVFVDQILMIEILAASLPDGWAVYVKEHPSQWWLRGGIMYSCNRYPGYYNKIASIKGVQLVPINTNSFDLIHHSQAVTTVTGTAGWEAIVRSKPTLIFGYPWYRDFSKLFRIKDTESCKQALQKIERGFAVDQQDVINFLKSFDEATIHAYVEGFVDKISKLNKQESMDNISKIIFEHLKMLSSKN
jgi:hypothetical protein